LQDEVDEIKGGRERERERERETHRERERERERERVEREEEISWRELRALDTACESSNRVSS